MIQFLTPRARTRLLRVASALSLALLAGTGCADLGEHGILDPQHSNGSSPDLSRIAVYSDGAPQLTIAWAMAWIGPAGGSVRLLDFELIVPPGAVSRSTRFAIRLPVDPGAANHALAEFEPHNVTFAQPVTIRLPYRGTSAEDATSRVLWWSGSSWVAYPTVLLEKDGRLQTTTTHFSTYGTEDPSRGITPLGG